MTKEQKSRLDREIDEILASKARQPIDFEQRRRTMAQPIEPTWRAQVRKVWSVLVASPLFLAYALVGLATLLDPAVHFLAVLLCLAAVLVIWLPGILRLIRPNGRAKTEVKYWRGQAYVSEIKSAGSRSPIDSLKRYFDARR